MQVIEKRKLMGVIPKFKTKQYAFGITPYGVVKINSHTGKVYVCHYSINIILYTAIEDCILTLYTFKVYLVL